MLITTVEENLAALTLINLLIQKDPAIDSEEGRVLCFLYYAVQEYERTHYHFESPNEEERANFLKEQACL